MTSYSSMGLDLEAPRRRTLGMDISRKVSLRRDPPWIRMTPLYGLSPRLNKKRKKSKETKRQHSLLSACWSCPDVRSQHRLLVL